MKKSHGTMLPLVVQINSLKAADLFLQSLLELALQLLDHAGVALADPARLLLDVAEVHPVEIVQHLQENVDLWHLHTRRI